MENASAECRQRSAGLTFRSTPAREAVDLRAYVYVVLMVVLGSTTAAAAKFAVRICRSRWSRRCDSAWRASACYRVVWGRGVLHPDDPGGWLAACSSPPRSACRSTRVSF